MEQIVKLINERLLSGLGYVTRTEESISTDREHHRQLLSSRDQSVDEAVEFIAFLDLNDKGWRERLAEDQKRMLLRVESLKLVEPPRGEPAEPEYEMLGFARKSTVHIAKERSRGIRIYHPQTEDEDYDGDDSEYVEIFIKKGALL